MSSPKQTPMERARDEIGKGRLWRAKDILSGALRHTPFDSGYYACYGELLLQMGDLREAGKFLFLSGQREERFAEAIGIYLSQFKGDRMQVYSSFPAKARLATLSAYPPVVAEELRTRGFEEVIRHPNAPASHKGAKVYVADGCTKVFGMVCLALVVIGLISGLLLGLKTVFRWIFE